MVAQVIKISPSEGPPNFCRTEFMTMMMTLSVASIRKGEIPSVRIFCTITGENDCFFSNVILMGTFLPIKNKKAKVQDANCAITVAMAAPATFISNRKMKIGSNIILVTAPIKTVIIPTAGKP